MVPRQPGLGWLRGSAVYASGSSLQRGVALLLLPLVLVAMSPAEYGQLALLTAIAGLASIVLSFGLEAAVTRSYFQLAGDLLERQRYVNTLGVFLLVTPAAAWAVFAVVVLAAGGERAQTDYLVLALAAAAVNVPATVIPMVILRLEGRLRAYFSLVVSTTVANATLIIVLVVWLRLGVPGYLSATLLAYLLMLGLGLHALGHRFTRDVSRAHLTAALAFGLPLVPHLLAHWGLNLSDRVILANSVTRDELGIYNVGYQVAALVGLVVSALN